MKQYVCMETETIYTTAELFKQWLDMEKDDSCETFPAFMQNASWYNGGTIAELLTDETKKADMSRAVMLCMLYDSNGEYLHNVYMNKHMIENEIDNGFYVVVL